MEKLWSNFTSYFGSAEVPLKSTVIGLVVYGVKEFFTRITFACPEVGYKEYGLLYLIVPAIVLVCLSLMASDSFWSAVTCCCQKLAGKKLRITWWKARKAIYLSTLLPLSWLVIAFVDTKFYVCATLGPKAAAMAKANTTEAKAEVNRKFQIATSNSQMIAWDILLGLVLFATILVTIMRLWYKFDPLIISKEDVDKDEADLVVQIFKERMQPLLEKKATGVVDDIFKDVDREDVGSLIKDGIDRLTKLYPSHGGQVQGLYKAAGDDGNGKKKSKPKQKAEAKSADDTELKVLVDK